MKATEQPIWLLVTVLLALVVGIAMYQLVAKARSATAFDDMLQQIDQSNAKINVDSSCQSWKDSNWAIAPQNIDQLSDFATKLGWITKDEWLHYEKFTKCDCAVYLYITGQGLTRSDVVGVYKPIECHEFANTMAASNGIA